MRSLIAAILCILIVCGIAANALAKKGAHSSHRLNFHLSAADVKGVEDQLSSDNMCLAILALFRVKDASADGCDGHQYAVAEGKQIIVDLSQSDDPGLVRYVLALKGSSELLASAKAGGSESHKFDVLFALDFDSTLYVHVFDLDARLSPRRPEASGDADYILMEHAYDTQNADLTRHISDAAVKFFEKKIDQTLVASGQSQ